MGALAQSSLLIAALLVYAITLPQNVVGQLAGFGAGALLAAAAFAMLTTSLIPFAYRKGGIAAGIWAVLGFALSLAAS